MNSLFRIVTVVLGAATAAVATPNVKTIRDIDFKNFTYPWDGAIDAVPTTWHWMNGAPKLHIRAIDGVHHFYEPGLSNYGRKHAPLISVDSVTYGDLDGDGAEEAAVALNYSTGGTANWDYLYIYKLEHGIPKLIDRLESGSRGSGGLVHISIRDGLLVLDFADADRRVGDCCSEGFIRVRYRWQAGRFVESGPKERGDLKLQEH